MRITDIRPHPTTAGQYYIHTRCAIERIQGEYLGMSGPANGLPNCTPTASSRYARVSRH
ncbi:hypothetical protein C8Q80DRAFT_1155730 [Daedaleopsis nitida]|nr:hypothetical protein C8Q80DRAFT_1155730 [Daedaleopsis nitida]